MRVAPYLSIVIAGRNDNYGGDFKDRLQAFVNWNTALLEKHAIPTEIIFVNYNPLASETPIEQFITWPKGLNFVRTRLLTVPATIHQQIVDEGIVKNVPVLEYYAKNIGIRRATGEFILSMNPDILIPESIVAKFKNLSANTYYRADRLDFDASIKERPINLEILKQSGTHYWLKGYDFAIKKAPSFWFASLYKAYALFISSKYKLRLKLNPLYYLVYGRGYHYKAEVFYHCNVSGDFMLMHRQHWLTLKGYPESKKIALHVDSLLVVMAAQLGLREFVFSEPIYHKNHTRRYDAKLEDDFFTEVYLSFEAEAEKMVNARQPMVYNSYNWGFANIEIIETKF